MQGLVKVYTAFGNGDIGKGKKILQDAMERLGHARTKHPKKEWQNMGITEADKALDGEKKEVTYAIQNETPERVYDELLDVMAVTVRMMNREYKK